MLVLTRIVKSLLSLLKILCTIISWLLSGTGADLWVCCMQHGTLSTHLLAHAGSRGMFVEWTGPQHSCVGTCGQALALGSVAETLNVLWLWLEQLSSVWMVATEPQKPQLLEGALETGQLLAAVMTPPPFSPELTAWACVLWTSHHLSCSNSTLQLLLLRAHRKQNAHDLHLVRFPSADDKKKISIPTFGICSSWNLFRLRLTESGAAQPWKAGRATSIYEMKMHGNFQFLRIPKAFLQRNFYLHCGHLLMS